MKPQNQTLRRSKGTKLYPLNIRTAKQRREWDQYLNTTEPATAEEIRRELKISQKTQRQVSKLLKELGYTKKA